MLPALHRHQRCTQTERGYTRGASSAHILVADYQLQDWSGLRTRAGIANPRPEAVMASGHRNSHPTTMHRAFLLPALGGQLPVSAIRSCSRPFNSYGARLQPRSIIRATGLPSDTAHSATVKPSYQLTADRYLSHFRVLSFVRLDRFKPSEASNGRVPKPTRAFHRNEGELPNVCG